MILNPLTYALLAEDAYTAIPQIGAEDSAARAIIEHTIDGLAFAFPGTNNIACWLADLDIEVVQTPLGGVHAGFNKAALSLLDGMGNYLSGTTLRILLTGHSEGADLALLIGGYLCLKGRPPLAIFAFEPARCSIDSTLAELFKANGVDVRIYHNGNDVVPMVPRLLHPWQHPAPVTAIGVASETIPNVPDHMMTSVIPAVRELVGVA